MQILKIEKVKPSGLHSATRNTLLICRLFGLFPVIGLTYSNKSELRFKALSPYNILCVAIISGQFLVFTLCLYYLASNELNLRNLHKFVINANGLILTSLITWLATKWPALVHETSKIERSLPQISKRNISRSCTTITFVMFFGSILEHIFAIIFYARLSGECTKSDSLVQAYFEYIAPWAFMISSFSYWKAIFLEIFFIQMLLVTTIADALIAAVSLYTTTFFQDLNDMITLYKEKPGMWSTLRNTYTRLTYLVRLVNTHVTCLVLVSFGSNLIFICVQLFKVIRKDQVHDSRNCNIEKFKATLNSIERLVYFVYSFLFLVFRSLFTGLTAARLHSTSRASLSSLHEVHLSSHTAECQRFLEQIYMTNVSLTGLDFFNVTRSMILSMAGTIVTYELVLLQFTGEPGIST